MTERQLYALTHPLARADGCPDGEFSRAIRVGSLTLFTILTVNK